MPVVLYGCETLSLTLRVFENRMLRRISEPKREKVMGEWRDYIMRHFISCVMKPRRMGQPGHVACMGDGRGAYTFWWGNLREEITWKT